MKTICFITLGCKVNQYETQGLREVFLRKGFTETAQDADVCIVNTCNVTRNAAGKSKDAIRRIRKKNPSASLAVTGCLAEFNQKEIEGLGVDYVVPHSRKYTLPSLFFETYLPSCRNNWALAITDFKNTRAFVKIQDGCSKACAFCNVRKIRKQASSRPTEEIVEELRRLDQQGFKEIVLCGINTALYGEEGGYAYDLARLLRDIAQKKFNFRVRLSSMDPASFRESFFSVFKLAQVCPFAHLSFQSGDDAVLQRMNKRATAGEYEVLVKRLRQIQPECAISCDIIVGFTGETEAGFENTLRFIQRTKPMRIHIFRYSEPTLNITALKKLSTRIVDERYGVLKKLAEECTYEYSKYFQGKVLNVLIEGKRNGFFVGYSENYLRVLIPDKEEVRLNEIIPVTITKTEPCGRIYGTVLKEWKKREVR